MKPLLSPLDQKLYPGDAKRDVSDDFWSIVWAFTTYLRASWRYFFLMSAALQSLDSPKAAYGSAGKGESMTGQQTGVVWRDVRGRRGDGEVVVVEVGGGHGQPHPYIGSQLQTLRLSGRQESQETKINRRCTAFA